MSVREHVPPNSPDDWIAISERELDNVRKSYLGKLSNDAKVDHALRATEAVLKALVWKYEGWPTWPSERDKNFKFLYGHKFEVMLDHCGLRTRLRASAEHWASWQTLVSAVLKQPRYSPYVPSDAEANQIVKSARDLDVGVVPWLRKHYRQMN